MQIDLNDPGQLTEANVALLIGSVKDDRHWQLRVTEAGVAYLSEKVGLDGIEGLAFRLETWDRGNSYVGSAAAQDAGWVSTVFRQLSENWPTPRSSYIDF